MYDVELPMCFESAHSVPKLFKVSQFVTSVLIAYDEPRGPSKATRLSKQKNFVSCKKSISADGIQAKYHTSNMVAVKYCERNFRQSEKSHAVAGGPS